MVRIAFAALLTCMSHSPEQTSSRRTNTEHQSLSPSTPSATPPARRTLATATVASSSLVAAFRMPTAPLAAAPACRMELSALPASRPLKTASKAAALAVVVLAPVVVLATRTRTRTMAATAATAAMAATAPGLSRLRWCAMVARTCVQTLTSVTAVRV